MLVSYNLTPVPERRGECYAWAGRWVLDHPDWLLVHGYLGKVKHHGVRYDHAWCVKDQYLYEPLADQVTEVLWYGINFDHQAMATYTHDEMCERLREHGHWGSWHDLSEWAQ